MTIAPAKNLPIQAVQSASPPALRLDALPSVLTETKQLDGWRNPQWVARDLLPGEAVELQQTLIALDMRLQSAPEGKTMELVSRLLNNWKNDRTDDEKAWQFDDFAEDLEEYSEAHLAEACRTWRRANGFPPKIADLRALCDTARGRDQMMHRRCRVLLGMEPPRSWEKAPTARGALKHLETGPVLAALAEQKRVRP